MTPLLRFFLLALTPLLAVTVSFGPALLFGLVTTLLLASVAAAGFFLKASTAETKRLWASVALAAVMVTLVDLAVSVWLPGVRAVWGPYLNLLAFSPLVMLSPFGRPSSNDLAEEFGLALKTGLGLTALFAFTALLREGLGLGSLTMLPGSVSWKIPGLADYPLAIAATGAGAFFLAAAGIVAYRFMRPLLPAWQNAGEIREASPVPPPRPSFDLSFPELPSRPSAVVAETPLLESSEDWGETLVSAVADLPSVETKDRRRVLIIGSGNGELAYYLAMLCLDQTKTDKGFKFRVRGVDHFLTRVETAVRGLYRDHQIETIPPMIRDAWMVRGQGEDKYLWRVADEVRLNVQFEVADFQQGQLFYPQPAHLIVLNQGIEYVTDDKKVQLLKTVCDHLTPGGALVVTGQFKRELLPEGMKRTGTTVFRKG
jgi:chemotaxis methyl-accepting protein methylase/Na+-translocating ferredoxin:NAD+ oxidoreductase RnfE subunit